MYTEPIWHRIGQYGGKKTIPARGWEYNYVQSSKRK